MSGGVERLTREARKTLHEVLKDRYDDYKERLVGNGDEILRGRAQELRDLLAEIEELTP